MGNSLVGKKLEWIPTDTAAIMFTAINSRNYARIIRAAAILKQDVEPEILKTAVRDVVPLYPVFSYTLRKGAFWGYMEKTDVLPAVVEEKELPAVPQWLGANGGPEYRIVYYKRRISLEISHVLCDGTGMFEFLKSIVARYLTLCGVDTSDCEEILLPGDEIPAGQDENAYVKYFTKEKLETIPSTDAYAIPFRHENDFLMALIGIMPVAQLKIRCKELGITVTEYLVAAMMLAVIRNAPEPIKKDISVAVPTNIRKLLPSDTLRNFSKDVPVDFNPCGRTDWTLEEIAAAIKGRIASLVNETNLHAFINSTYKLTVNKAVGLIPGFVKWKGLAEIQKVMHQKTMSVMLSNLGVIKLPQSMSENVTRLDFFGGNPKCYGMNMFCSALGYNGYIYFCFSQCNRDTSLNREFFRIITADGIDVRIESTHGNGVNSYEM